MAKSKSKKANNTKAKATKKAPPPAKFLSCGETGERIFVCTATLKDIQNPPKNQKRKVLYKVPSLKTRTELYDELALCLEDCESRRLPKYGGRPWQVICRVSDGSSNKSSPFFRWYRGKLELAVLPHLLEKIPEPPKFPGYKKTNQGVVRRGIEEDSDDEEEYDNLTEEEIQRMESLLAREISSLSQVAWDHRNDNRLGAPLPNISLKWTCPLRQIFTSRKAAWDHALELAEAEQFVDRFLRGISKTGAPLKPFRPTRAQALQAGKVRFLRDGLWVVGQEQAWQNDRYLSMEQQKEKKPVEKPGVIEPVKKRRKITGSMLFLAVHRVAYKERREQEIKSGRTSPPEPTKDDDNPQPKKKSKTSAKVGLPTPQKKAAPKKFTFSLADAERELRSIWKKELTDEERNVWEYRANSSFQRKIDLDDQKRWDLAAEEEAQDESASESEEESGGEEEKKEVDDHDRINTEEAVKIPSEVVQLATEAEREIWEIFSEAEQERWKAEARKTVKSFFESKKTAANNSSDHPLQDFYTYQCRVFEEIFGKTPEKYEEDALNSLRAAERRKQQAEHQKQKELLAKGMRKLSPASYSLIENRVEKWLTNKIQGAANSKKRAAKKLAAPPKTSTAGSSSHTAKSDEEPELLKTMDHRITSVDTSSTPISPSPPLDPSGLAPTIRQTESKDPPADHASHKDEYPDNSLSDQDSSEATEFRTEEAEKEEEQEEYEEKQDENEQEEKEEEPRFIPTKHYCLSDEQIKLCYDACMEHFDGVMRTVKARDLTRELADGFDLLRERGRGRYDMELPAFETNKFDFLNDVKKAPWIPIVKQVLGDDIVLIHKGCFLSLPDAANQNYHQDGPHLHTTSQKPCHAVNVFTPLIDMTMQHGPTEFCLGSHILGQEDWEKRHIYTPLQKKGVPVMFDYRLGHRGLANTSKDPRPIVYCTYARAGEEDGKEFRDSVNFSRRRYRKLGDLVDKPESREERNKKRRAQLDEQWWEEFPEALQASADTSAPDPTPGTAQA